MHCSSQSSSLYTYLLFLSSFSFFFFNDTATTEIYTLSLHDALPIFGGAVRASIRHGQGQHVLRDRLALIRMKDRPDRSEEHTSELQSRPHLVCRLLLEKKKNRTNQRPREQHNHKDSGHHSSSALQYE